MKKIIYEKPSMTVATLCTQHQLMTGSNLGAGFGGNFNGDGLYIGGYTIEFEDLN